MISLMRNWLFGLLVCLCTHVPIHSATAQTLEVVTEIRDLGPLSFQVGEKSRQTIVIDAQRRQITSRATTGVTQVIPGWNWGSVRDGFGLTASTFGQNTISFTTKGQTASAVHIMPDIDYNFNFVFDLRRKVISVSGCHNEFPSYRILMNGRELYNREQTGLAFTGLLGVCDIVLLEDYNY